MTTQIPSHLLPRDGRFGSGPSKVRPAQLAHLANAGSLMGTSHRQRPVRQLVGKIRSQLSELCSAPDGYEVILGNGGASLLWDAIAFNIVQERAQAAVFGEFSSKPVKPLSNVPWVTEVDVRRVEPGGVALCESVDGIDTYLYAHNETSTGALSPVHRFGDDDALTVVDATSAAGGVLVDLSETDFYYFSPQKCFGADGGLWLAPEAAKAHGEAMMKAGADIIDIGAESTRPGAKRVSEADEKARVLGAVDALIPEGAVLSIDTTRASVALAALEHGAQIINDVSGGQLDRELPHVVADHSDCLYIVQHWRGWLAGAAGNVPDADTSRYEHGVVNDVYDELMRQVDAVLEAGVQAEQVIIDPGLGFSKPGVEHNLPIQAALDRFNAAGYPVLIGASRKRFVGSLLAGAGVTEPDMASKDNATAAISALCAEHGVWAVRVHDVAKSRDAVAVGNAWREYANA